MSRVITDTYMRILVLAGVTLGVLIALGGCWAIFASEGLVPRGFAFGPVLWISVGIGLVAMALLFKHPLAMMLVSGTGCVLAVLGMSSFPAHLVDPLVVSNSPDGTYQVRIADRIRFPDNSLRITILERGAVFERRLGSFCMAALADDPTVAWRENGRVTVTVPGYAYPDHSYRIKRGSLEPARHPMPEC